MKALAIDFGGTHATCGLVEDRILLAHETMDTHCVKNLHAVLPRIRDACRGLMHGRGFSPGDIAGVAMGFAALVDSRANRVLSTDRKYEDVKDIDLAKWIHEKCWRAATNRERCAHGPVGRILAWRSAWLY